MFNAQNAIQLSERVPDIVVIETPAQVDTQTNTTTEDIRVGNQMHGSTVIIDSVLYTGPAWIVIHATEKTADAKYRLTEIIGAKYTPLPSIDPVSIPLLKDTVEGNEYIVTLYMDNGDNIFDPRIDSQVTKPTLNAVFSAL